MSCPDWPALRARRDSDPGETEWLSALEHLDGCEDCRGRALAADPTLLFRRLPVFEAGPGEIEAMQRAVAGMRRGEATLGRRQALPRSLLRAAALAAVILGSVLLRGAGEPPMEAEPPVEAGPTPVVEAVPAAASEIDLGWLPLVETIDPAYASLIEVVDDDISLVVVLPSDVDA